MKYGHCQNIENFCLQNNFQLFICFCQFNVVPAISSLTIRDRVFYFLFFHLIVWAFEKYNISLQIEIQAIISLFGREQIRYKSK
jgi:hypothetical protein